MPEQNYNLSELQIEQSGDGHGHGEPGSEFVSLDPQGGTSHPNGKPIWTPEQVAAYFNRTGGGFHGGPQAGPQSDSDLSVIKFGFHTGQQSLQDNGYVYFVGDNGFAFSEYFNFAQFNDAQKAAAREALQSWDDLIAVSLVESDIDSADIAFGNLASAPTTQAYAYVPRPVLTSNPDINAQILEVGGDVWISLSQPSNLQLDEGRYGMQTMAHEIGHALGLSHPGAYNAAPGLSITYGANAEYAQDTRAYSIMSYFEASSLGARHFDFHMSTTAYAGAPLIHDILAAQRVYGADMTTRTGDTVYGFNSTAGRDAFDFVKTPAPIGAIWDAGGIDTLDTSGFATTQLIDLRAGSLSSIGGVTYDTAPTLAQVNANRAAEGLAPVALTTYNSNMAALLANPVVGRLTDNFGIAYGVTIENAIGGSGADTMFGNEVANVLTGNAGNDVLNGLAGDDTLNGNVGDDSLDGGVGNDSMTGGTGNDTYFIDAVGDSVSELAGEGTDTVSSGISYTLGNNVENLILTGSAANGTGNGLDNLIVANAVANVINGGAGFDTVSYRESTSGVNVNLSGTVSGGYATGDKLISIEGVEGSNFADILGGSNGNDRLSGLAGSDLLDGGNGNDQLDGGADNDRLTGGNGNDGLLGGLGDDILDAGNGDDQVDGGAGVDRLTGDNGNDVLLGGLGDDVLEAGNGNDIVDGGAGNDRLRGDNGNDIFRFGSDSVGGADVIEDFKRGQDKIDLKAFGIDAGDVTFGSGGNVFVDVNNDGVADFSFVTQNVNLTASDFLFV
ncbi:MAG TPA: M10 family metallopeptidase C-terminal domain-containing protein [Allosphingosinicella sp.]|nr:M10 family metallopeptidase C-terminal domain-containing protein [Allosphingosinicella sp.]